MILEAVETNSDSSVGACAYDGPVSGGDGEW
jgi:hypothetical protein